MSDYITSDTAEATYLIVKSKPPKFIDYDKPRFEFTFEDNGLKITELANEYITGNALVDPAVYNRVNKKLLRIIRSRIQWGDE